MLLCGLEDFFCILVVNTLEFIVAWVKREASHLVDGVTGFVDIVLKEGEVTCPPSFGVGAVLQEQGDFGYDFVKCERQVVYS